MIRRLLGAFILSGNVLLFDVQIRLFEILDGIYKINKTFISHRSTAIVTFFGGDGDVLSVRHPCDVFSWQGRAEKKLRGKKTPRHSNSLMFLNNGNEYA